MKISLIELAQMKEKPKEIYRIFKSGIKELYEYDGCNYRNKAIDVLMFVNLEDYDKKIIEIVKEPILDEKEKEYLKAVIKPFRNEINYIKKSSYGELENIIIVLKHSLNLNFPNFDKGTMYKGMKANRCYSLEDLDI